MALENVSIVTLDKSWEMYRGGTRETSQGSRYEKNRYNTRIARKPKAVSQALMYTDWIEQWEKVAVRLDSFDTLQTWLLVCPDPLRANEWLNIAAENQWSEWVLVEWLREPRQVTRRNQRFIAAGVTPQEIPLLRSHGRLSTLPLRGAASATRIRSALTRLWNPHMPLGKAEVWRRKGFIYPPDAMAWKTKGFASFEAALWEAEGMTCDEVVRDVLDTANSASFESERERSLRNHPSNHR